MLKVESILLVECLHTAYTCIIFARANYLHVECHHTAYTCIIIARVCKVSDMHKNALAMYQVVYMAGLSCRPRTDIEPAPLRVGAKVRVRSLGSRWSGPTCKVEISAARAAVATGASGQIDTHVSDTWKCGSSSFIFTSKYIFTHDPPEDSKNKRRNARLKLT